ncbi:hypothetical protein [Streptomyces sp. NPDC086023]|uniref:hypothetical protein n=1 Tax=Streptomyces sp. NPDC086023 TaxID=3365746 RepID=UPI0037CF5F18
MQASRSTAILVAAAAFLAVPVTAYADSGPSPSAPGPVSQAATCWGDAPFRSTGTLKNESNAHLSLTNSGVTGHGGFCEGGTPGDVAPGGITTWTGQWEDSPGDGIMLFYALPDGGGQFSVYTLNDSQKNLSTTCKAPPGHTCTVDDPASESPTITFH